MAKITWLDKVFTRVLSADRINKVTDADLNELKASINALYNKTGWAYYQDNGDANIVINTSFQKISINSLGADTDEDYLPLPIRGEDSLWDTVNNKITPIALGDTYEQRFDFNITAKSGGVTRIDFVIDIGGQSTPTNIIGNRIVTAEKTAPFTTNYDFPLFVKNTFLANGAQIFAKVDTGTVTIGQRALFLERKHAEV